MIKTIIVDDHKLFSEGVERLLIGTGQFEIIEKFTEGRSLLMRLPQLTFDLMLLDIDMPELSGLDVVKRIRVSNKKVKLVVLSMHGEAAFLNEAKALGANAYLTKSIDGNQLIDSLLRVCSGSNIFPTLVPIQHQHESFLSDREKEILQLLSKGFTSEAVAEKLSISPLTVKVHRRNMMRKLKTKNSMELMSKALEMGYL